MWSERRTKYGVVESSLLPQQKDTTDSYRLGLSWVPYDYLTSALFVQRQNRDSNAASADYRDNQYGLNLELRY